MSDDLVMKQNRLAAIVREESGKYVVEPGQEVKQGKEKHGRWGSITYTTWKGIKSRTINCKDLSRKIDIDPRWADFEAFYDDVGERPSLSHHLRRIDKTRGYYKDNCQWYKTAHSRTKKAFGGNHKRKETPTSGWNRRVTYRGVTKTVKQWADLFDISVSVLYQRLFKLNWPFEKALFEAVRHKRSTRVTKSSPSLPMANAAILDRQRQKVDQIREKELRRKYRQ